jgi:hypothetical protein
MRYICSYPQKPVECYNEPQEGYAVDLAIPDPSLIGGFDYENVILYPEQFVVDEDYHCEPFHR